MTNMKHTLPLLTLVAALAPLHADEPPSFTVPVPPPLAEDVRFEAAVEPAPGRDRVFFFAQARPEDNRDRNDPRPSAVPRPPNAPNPPQPPGGYHGEGFGGGSSKGETSYSVNARGFVTQRDGRGRLAPVIVTSKPLDSKDRAAAEEDLGIMARLLEKEIEREGGSGNLPNALGIPIVTRFEGRSSVMLLEGYGAVFTFTTGMRLTPPPARPAEKKSDRPTDSPWERTRRELFGPPGGGNEGGGLARRFEAVTPGGTGRDFGGGAGGMMGFGGGGGGKSWGAQYDHVPYDAKKVEELKRSILEALKQAGNIRALKAADYLTVVVQGGGGGGFGPMEVAVETRTVTGSSSGNTVLGSSGGPPHVETFINHGGDGQRSGTLTVRAKKSDAEDFAKGKLTAEQFEKAALVNVH